jgi:glutathione S-transferase
LSELGIPFEEEIIDLDTPRTAEYLQVNPRGLVPSLKWGSEIITESAIVATFLADAFPKGGDGGSSGLWPASTAADGPLTRARITFFVDAYFSKVNGLYHKTQAAATEDEREKLSAEFVAAAAKELEPL